MDDPLQEFQAVCKVRETVGTKDDFQIIQLAMHVNRTDTAVQDGLPRLQVGFGFGNVHLRLFDLGVDLGLLGLDALQFRRSRIQICLDALQLCTHILDNLFPVFLLQARRINLPLEVRYLVIQIIRMDRCIQGASAKYDGDGEGSQNRLGFFMLSYTFIYLRREMVLPRIPMMMPATRRMAVR